MRTSRSENNQIAELFSASKLGDSVDDLWLSGLQAGWDWARPSCLGHGEKQRALVGHSIRSRLLIVIIVVIVVGTIELF